MWVPDDYKMNKYGVPAYDQFNFDLTREFEGTFDGLNVRFLYVLRRSKSIDLEAHEEHNKVNFNHFNLIFNYNF